ncbi:hypothetical protein EGT07_23015 [Herbaspirillum sp. HC18]|nr:hypothetical protein EGT07_23015 [Herbaspirillum sp. HC18]
MYHPSYFIKFEDHRESTLDAFAKHLCAMPKKVVSTVQLSELCAMANHPNGLYLFFDDEDVLWYVGKSTSRSFIERVPSHFVQREGAWFATLPKRIMTVCSIAEYSDAHALGLSLRLVLVGMKSKETAIRLESVLRSYMKPYLNSGKSNNYTGGEVLASYEI